MYTPITVATFPYIKYATKASYLVVGTLVIDLGQNPVHPAISREEDGVVRSRLLLQLDGDWHQLVIPIHVEQAQWSTGVVALPEREPVQYFHVAEVHTSSLVVCVGAMGTGMHCKINNF